MAANFARSAARSSRSLKVPYLMYLFAACVPLFVAASGTRVLRARPLLPVCARRPRRLGTMNVDPPGPARPETSSASSSASTSAAASSSSPSSSSTSAPVAGTLAALEFGAKFADALPADPLTAPDTRQVRGAAYSLVAPTPPEQTDQLPVWARGLREGLVARPPPPLVRALAGWSPSAAKLLGVRKFASKDAAQEIAVLGGFGDLLPGMRPFAANYGGHQFGVWAGQLGDGRAIALGDTAGWELQLKGAGSTPYSRRADGRAVLRSSVREFLCSESMHFLGVPTTRALSLVTTGTGIIRDMFYTNEPELEPGAVVCRMAPTFLRLGSFQLPASRGEFELLQQFADFAIDNYFTDLKVPEHGNRYTEFVREVSRLNAVMVARWMGVGFVHGVMNTDNFSILGLTIDYGPYGFLDAYDPEYTPNSSDMPNKRYKYAAQPEIARWNILQFVQSMVSLTSVAEMQSVVDDFPAVYKAEYNRMFAGKLGLGDISSAEDAKLLEDFLDLLEATQVDFTNGWRMLCKVEAGMAVEDAFSVLEPLFLGKNVEKMQWELWLLKYVARVESDETNEVMTKEQRKKTMDGANPVYILRNYMAQNAIEKATEGDFTEIETLYKLLSKPFEVQDGMDKYTQEPPDWALRRGVKVNSCSS